VPIEFDNELHCEEFIRLNELWITEYFQLEAPDRELAADPMKIVADGGHIITLTEDGRVVGVCALFKETDHRFQLARMAVEPGERGKGYGNTLIQAALARAHERGATSVFLLSNTVLQSAIALYRKHGFEVTAEGPHPIYTRCNIVMERRL
jgi:N-acetylglutamate synthase-like GNAT family acetyltransferase